MTLPTGQKKNNLSGFTLIELLLVSIIISSLIGMAIPRVGGAVSSLALRNSSKDIAALIRYAQQEAIVERINYRINFDPGKSNYWLTRQKIEDNTKEYERLKTSLGRKYPLPQKVRIISLKFKDTGLSEQNHITCYPDGYVDKATLIISDRRETFSITTTGRIGQIIIKRNE